jgi:hypothetical protein
MGYIDSKREREIEERKCEKRKWKALYLGERKKYFFSGFEGSQAVPARPSSTGTFVNGEALGNEKVKF